LGQGLSLGWGNEKLNQFDENALGESKGVAKSDGLSLARFSPVRLVLGLVLAGAAFYWLGNTSSPEFARFLLPAGILALTFLVSRFPSVPINTEKQNRVQDNLLLASAVFEATSEGIMITDAENKIISVNSAFVAITGYSSSEAIGQAPSMLRSERHGDAFYTDMWQKLQAEGRWEGELWNRRRNGDVFATWMSIIAIHDAQGEVRNYVGIMADIDRRKKAEEEAKHRTKVDLLTGLSNRRNLMQVLKTGLVQARASGERAALLNININNFRFLNESLGNAAGDQLLVVVAQRIRNSVGDLSEVSRIGGDEFAVWLPTTEGPEASHAIAAALGKALASPMKLSGQDERLSIAVSIGVALFPDHSDDAEDLFRKADIATGHARKSEKSGIALFDAGMDSHAKERLALEGRMRRALEKEEFTIHYQPKVDLRTGLVNGMEALVRWDDPENGMISPATFIPIAEETGLIVPLGDWVLKTACAQAKQWSDEGFSNLRLAVNLSTLQLQNDSVADDIARIVEESGFDPGHLDMEITESAIMVDTAKSISIIEDLGKKGMAFAIDDFGTGYSSLSYLKNLPISALKIDRSFVSDVDTNEESARLAAAILSLGQSLNLKVVAEGVENEEQLAFLKQHYCDEMQGFFFSKPLPEVQFKALLQEGKRL